MMSHSEINPFLAYLCKELSIQFDVATKRQKALSSPEFSELIITTVQETLDAYISGELDLQSYYGFSANDYKLLAQKSIDSYSTTNDKFNEITEKHADLIEESTSADLIEFGKISEKFGDIQNHLNHEVQRANKVIKELSNQVKNLEIKTTLDPLTKTYNRHALQEHLLAILYKEHFNYDMYALMIDIDDFKLINDRYGHIVGDKVLIFIAKIMKKALRDGDRVYRFGGEEFIILINRTDNEGAKLIAERLLNLCRQNKPLVQNKQLAVTLSIGLTKIVKGDTIDSVVGRSDSALYKAKNNGKDRLEMEF